MKATVTASDGEVKTYTGLTKRAFKDRLYEHRNDANNPKHRTHTKLAGYVWRKKDQNVTIDNYKWEIRKKCFSYHSCGMKCSLCLTEKNAHHEGQGSTQPEPKNRTNEFVQAPLDV